MPKHPTMASGKVFHCNEVGVACFFGGYVNDQVVACRSITPPKFSSSPLKNDGWKTTFLLERKLFRGYVKLQECIHESPLYKRQETESSMVYIYMYIVCCIWFCWLVSQNANCDIWTASDENFPEMNERHLKGDHFKRKPDRFPVPAYFRGYVSFLVSTGLMMVGDW